VYVETYRGCFFVVKMSLKLGRGEWTELINK
jgi:hypothetical protein